MAVSEEEPSDGGSGKSAPSRRYFNGGVAPARFPRLRLSILAFLLLSTLYAIHTLRKMAREDRVTVLITAFRAVGSGVENSVLEKLTDRVATKVSRLSQVRMVILDRNGGTDPTATVQLSGVLSLEGGEIRVEVRLRDLSKPGRSAIHTALGPADRVETLADSIVQWIGENLSLSG